MPDNSDIDILLPPPIIYSGCVLAGSTLEYFWPHNFLDEESRIIVGLILMTLSSLLFGMALREFTKYKTSPELRKPTTILIKSGPFAWSRNPVYVSMTLFHMGVGFYFGSTYILAMIIPAVMITQRCVIFKEEKYLYRTFGDEYHRYKKAVRRWF